MLTSLFNFKIYVEVHDGWEVVRNESYLSRIGDIAEFTQNRLFYHLLRYLVFRLIDNTHYYASNQYPRIL